MSINTISTIRKKKDLENLENSDMSNDGIYYKINHDENKLIAMIIGPKDTPYEGGFYFFDIYLPERYPFKPPVVKFLTTDGKSRMNPNLYTNGKVCLSILGTWTGPSWTTCMNVTTVLLALVTVLNENPIQNEPGHENDKLEWPCVKDYNQFLIHENIRIAVILNYKSINNPACAVYLPFFFEPLKKHISDNIHFYMDKVKEISGYNTIIKARIYNCIHANEHKQFNDFFKVFIEFYNISYTSINTDLKSVIKEKSNKKKCPSTPAKQFDIGYILTSDNDNLKYIVILQKNGVKRWVKNKI